MKRWFLFLLIIMNGRVTAQDATITLTLAVDVTQQSLLDDAFFEPFEATHPNVNVIPVLLDSNDTLVSSPDSDAKIHALGDFAGQADVLTVTSDQLNPAITRTGIFLDLSPLLNVDPINSRSDFYPAFLQSFEWDGGLWALPSSGSVITVLYNADAFDALGLSYPNNNWTIADYVKATTDLVQHNNQGQVTRAGITVDTKVLMRMLLGHGFYNGDTFPEIPDLNNFHLAQLLELWRPIAIDNQQAHEQGFQIAPLVIGGLVLSSFSEQEYRLAELPNSPAVVQAAGYAVSSGTQYPELAYQLAQYLSTYPHSTYSLASDIPARPALVGDETSFPLQTRTDVQVFLEQVIPEALPASEIRFGNYVQQALQVMLTDNLSAAEALQQVQEIAEETLSFASNQHPLITVVTPVPTALPQQTILNFGINGEQNPLPNIQFWRDASNNFAVQDPEIDSIQFDLTYRTLEEQLERNDCFYMENVIPSGAVEGLLNLAPLLAADPTYIADEMLTGVMEQVDLNEGIWGFPLTMHPIVMYANRGQFEQANLSIPDVDWTVSEFEDMMHQFDNSTGLIYRSELFGGVYLMMLMAVYGGRLIDETTEPHTFYLDDPTNIIAVRQVLDWAREGRLQYNQLVSQFGGMFSDGNAPLYDGYFSVDMLRSATHQLLLYPQGASYRPAMYGLHVLYINANSEHPQACYRWFQFIRQHVELMLGMPTNRSLLEDSASYYSGNDDVLTFYQAYDQQLQDPTTIILQSPFLISDQSYSIGIQNAIATRWMHLAFDKYVLRDGDLEADLLKAQENINLFYDCASGIEDRSIEAMTDTQRIAYSEEFANCARAVDPDWSW